ncbi:MAG: hypothetical protein IKP40_05010 [Clostridia bacterium]|nr:hypothetical protein [Clostridia bacterium]
MSIIRKTIAIALALALCLSGTVLADEAAAVTAETFLGEWVDQDGTCNISFEEHYVEGELLGYVVAIVKDTPDEEAYDYLVWGYACVYDEEAKAMRSISCVKGFGWYDKEDEDIDYVEEEAEFFFGEDGLLVWNDLAGQAGEGMKFEHTIGSEIVKVPADSFPGVWVCDTTIIEITADTGVYTARVYQPVEDTQVAVWTYVCAYDEERGFLANDGKGVKTLVTLNEEGEQVSEEVVAENRTGGFAFDPEGHLRWADLEEEGIDEMHFESAGLGLDDVPEFDTLGEAMEAAGEDAVRGGDEDHQVIAMKWFGKYIRVVANLDDKARELYEAVNTAEPEDISAAFEAVEAYLPSLPVVYTEELTAKPIDQADLDVLVGKTMAEAEEAGFSFSSSFSGEETDPVTFEMSNGLFLYEMVSNESAAEYEAMESYENMTVQSVRFLGLSSNAAELRYHADGTAEPEEDPFAVFNELMQVITDAITAAQENGEVDVDQVIEQLVNLMPEHEDEIREMVPMVMMLMTMAQETPAEQ